MAETRFVDFASDPEEVWALFPAFAGVRAFDVGANGGMLARIFAEHFAQVVAFEPCRESFAKLVQDSPPNVLPLPVALAAESGDIVLDETDLVTGWGELKMGSSMERIWGPTTRTRAVPAMTLDLAADVFGHPDFVKIDTEGSEWVIVQGGRGVFARKPRFVIEVHSQPNGEQIQRVLRPIYGDIEVVHHPGYPFGSHLYHNHYYLIGG